MFIKEQSTGSGPEVFFLSFLFLFLMNLGVLPALNIVALFSILALRSSGCLPKVWVLCGEELWVASGAFPGQVL